MHSIIHGALLAAATAAASAGGPPDGARLVLRCDVCRVVMRALSLDLKYLHEKERTWPIEVLKKRVTASCTDNNIAQGALQEACADWVTSQQLEIADFVMRYLDDTADEFEELLVPHEACRALGVCLAGQKSIQQTLSEHDVKEKDLEKQKKGEL